MRGVLVRELYSAARSARGKINENKFSIVRSIQVLIVAMYNCKIYDVRW